MAVTMEERPGKRLPQQVETASGVDPLVRNGAPSGSLFGEKVSVSLPLSPVPINRGSSALRRVSVGDYTLMLPDAPSAPPGPAYEYSKRCLDIAVATSMLLLLLPVLVAIAVLIYAEDPGDIFYYQERVGKHGRKFRFYKFRSMVRNADAIKQQLMAQNEATGPIFKMKNDPRVTKVGRILRRYSLDELPQLINVLRGEMSLIGPRPHLPREVALYTERQQSRLDVQPGLLCFREVTGRSNMTFEQWMELDLLYCQYRSVKTDLLILMRTIPAVLKGEGAY